MGAFAEFLAVLETIKDPRRAEGKMYRLPHVVLFAILALVSGANSYRSVHTFIDAHLPRLRKLFGLNWRAAPAYTTVRWILQKLDADDVEGVFRRHAAALCAREAGAPGRHRHIAVDDKALRGSFDHFDDRKAAHVLSAFASGLALILGRRVRRKIQRDAGGAKAHRRTRPARIAHHRRRHALSKKPSRKPSAPRRI